MSPTPFVSKRAPVFADVPDEKWNDWRWQLSNRLNSVEDFEQVFKLTESERKALNSPGLFRVDVTPYYVSLINPEDPQDPIRRQIIPTAGEIDAFTGMMEDSLSEDRHSPVPGLVHRYPDRVLMLVTTQCASYCRYCTRARIVGDPNQTFSRSEFEAQIDYLKRTPQVRDVLLSGGDPLTLAPKLLEELLTRLREIPHIEVLRIGSRVPVFMPMRVTDELTDMLQR
ncbi:MAG TPA: KamA family radical SAM protein, partial [Anaerolineaceae bacterium]|nr:KamA family radical SAM protein [Anaerolineaceae bacterium]